MDLQEFQTKHSALFEQVKKMGMDEASADVDAKIAAAREEGAKAENARIKGIEDIDVPGAESIIAENKFNSTETKESISVKVLEAQKEQRLKMQSSVQENGEQLAEQLTGIESQDDASAESSEKKAVVMAARKAMNQGRK